MKSLLPSITLIAALGVLPLLWFFDSRVTESSKQTLMLGHNMDENHPVHKGMAFLAERVQTKSDGRFRIQIYPNGQLGTERQVLELLQYGAVAMTKVSSLSLESFVPLYGVFNLPYIFQDEAHCFRVLDGPIGAEMLASSRDKLFIGLTYYHGGARSFYARKPIRHPDDLHGLKIRVMGSRTAIEMLGSMGGSPAPMPYGEIYTALQQGVIDGAENNITALTLSRHGEVAKNFSFNKHIIAPDVLIISTRVFDSLPADFQNILRESAIESRDYQRKLWERRVAEITAEVRGMQVQILTPARAPFRERVLPLHKRMAARGAVYQSYIERIKATP